MTIECLLPILYNCSCNYAVIFYVVVKAIKVLTTTLAASDSVGTTAAKVLSADMINKMRAFQTRTALSLLLPRLVTVAVCQATGIIGGLVAPSLFIGMILVLLFIFTVDLRRIVALYSLFI